MGLERGKVHIGDARELAGQLAPQSVNMIVTSPPYFALRSYLPADHPDKAAEMGGEQTPDEFVANLVALFAALRPALHDTGTVWLNLGDSYWTKPNGPALGSSRLEGSIAPHAEVRLAHGLRSRGLAPGAKHKDLIGIPWMTAFALRADGWYLRSDVVWSKPNPMPESVRDRPTRSHEYLFLLSKKANYFYDADAIREEATYGRMDWQANGYGRLREADPRDLRLNPKGAHSGANNDPSAGRNKRDVWTIPTSPYPDAHFATFPPDLIRPCIRAGSSERGVCAACGAPWARVVERETAVPASYNGSTFTNGKTGAVHDTRGQGPRYTTKATDEWQPTCTCDAGVRPALILDPFCGSGTTCQVAVEEGRDWIGFDLDARSVGWTANRLRALPVRSLFAASPASAD